ncbi:MAG: hypothetical protein GX347_07510 [Epulopiscium sp.]|nr:hypothetical protein [Candidatus Epulonipiscium sp.]
MENRTIKIILSIIIIFITIKFGIPLLLKGMALLFHLVGTILGLIFVLIPLIFILLLIYWFFFKNKNK